MAQSENALAHRTGDLCSNPGPGENFSLKQHWTYQMVILKTKCSLLLEFSQFRVQHQSLYGIIELYFRPKALKIATAINHIAWNI